MGGFSTVSGDPLGTVMYADNVSFDGTARGGVITTDGQLLIGSSTPPHVRLGTISSSDGSINITFGNGTINMTSAFTWHTVTSTVPANPIQLVKENGYICAGAPLVTFLLPLAPVIGDSFIILAASSLWQVTQNANQQVIIGPVASTSGITGTTTANTLGDKVEFTYIGIFGGIATFIAAPPQGSLTLA